MSDPRPAVTMSYRELRYEYAKLHRKIERLRADKTQLVEACSRWLKEYEHPMPPWFVDAFWNAKEVQGE